MVHLKMILVAGFLFTLTIVFFGCNSNPVDPGTGSQFTEFPVTDGMKWNYKYEGYSYNPRPAGMPYNTDTARGAGVSQILGDTVLNGLQVKVMKTEYSQSAETWTSFTYYLETDTALLRIASRYFSIPFGPDSPAEGDSRNYTYRLNNKEYNSINELIHFADNDFAVTGNGDIVYDEPPSMLFKYPVSLNGQWLYKFMDKELYIHRKYLSYEFVSTPAGSSICMKVEKTLPSDFGNLQLFDYYSNKGPVKSDYSFKDVIVFNEFGEEIGLIDIKEIKVLTN